MSTENSPDQPQSIDELIRKFGQMKVPLVKGPQSIKDKYPDGVQLGAVLLAIASTNDKNTMNAFRWLWNQNQMAQLEAAPVDQSDGGGEIFPISHPNLSDVVLEFRLLGDGERVMLGAVDLGASA